MTPGRRHSAAVIAALLALAAPPASAETQLPLHSTFQTPPPESAEPVPGKTFLGVKLPALPQVRMPEVPSLPEMLSSVGALPEKVGLPNANHVIDAQFDKLVRKLDIAIPMVETLGYEVRNFEVDWTLPPLIKVRLQSSEDVSDAEYQHVLASVKGDLILESIILSLNGVHKIQQSSGLAPFKRAQLEVDVGLPPHVIMTFSDPSNKFHDRFTEHRAALKKAMADGKPFPDRKGPPDPAKDAAVPAPAAP